MRIIGVPILISLLVSVPTRAQSLEEALSDVGSIYAAAYLEPLVDGVGASLGSGLFQAAHVGRNRTGLTFYVGVRAMAMPLSDADRSFDLSYESSAIVDVDVGPGTVPMRLPALYEVRDAPGLFGSEDAASATVTVRHDTTVSFLGILLPVSIDTAFESATIGGLAEAVNLVPFAVLQGGVGSYLGTSLMVRWLPTINVKDLGALTYVGFGLRHDVSQYLPLLPFDLAVQGAWQRINVSAEGPDDLISSSVFAANVEASKRFGSLTLFGGVQTEDARVRVRYEQAAGSPGTQPTNADETESIPIRLDLRGANRMRIALGADLGLGPVHLYGDVNMGARTVFSAGLAVVY